MADTKNGGTAGYHPDMDAASHEKTYEGFIQFAIIMVMYSLGWVLFLAVGGVKHAWPSAWFGLFLVHVAAGIGLMSPSRTWKPSAAVLVLLLLMLVFY